MEHCLIQAFAWVEELHKELNLPGVTEGTFMSRPSLRHRGKSIIGSKDGEVLVVFCPLKTKEQLLKSQPKVYFQTEHYEGLPALLMRPECIDKQILSTRIEAAWRMNATKRQLANYQVPSSISSS